MSRTVRRGDSPRMQIDVPLDVLQFERETRFGNTVCSEMLRWLVNLNCGQLPDRILYLALHSSPRLLVRITVG